MVAAVVIVHTSSDVIIYITSEGALGWLQYSPKRQRCHHLYKTSTSVLLLEYKSLLGFFLSFQRLPWYNLEIFCSDESLDHYHTLIPSVCGDATDARLQKLKAP